MAKKKTAEKVKIEAVPVLRAQGDDSTPETPAITKSYIMRDDWIDKGVVNTVAFKSVDGEVQDLLVNGEPAGGGGSASLVRVSLINNTAEELEVGIVHLDPGGGPMPEHLEFYTTVDANSTLELNALTLGEYSKILAIGKIISAVTGEITIDPGILTGMATIHGPGTATISAGE